MSDPDNAAMEHFHDEADFEEAYEAKVVDEYGFVIPYAYQEEQEDEE